ncbi:MAG: ammonium transporter [Planctomycetaceae bacterium]
MKQVLLAATFAALVMLWPGSRVGLSDDVGAAAEDAPTAEAAVTNSSEATAETGEVSAEPVAELNSGDVAWMLTSSALVLMMTAPGLALFYGGLVRKKNILSVMMQCIFLMGMMSVVWALIGYSLAFGGDNPYFGDLSHAMLKGLIPASGTGGVALANEQINFIFQGMFFIITPALICGAFAERMKFSAMCVFMLFWGLLVYCPVCHWVWDGWMYGGEYEALDFAGGTVVHISSGVSALVCALLIGKRLGYGQEPMPPHNLTYTMIGTGLLWVGWFGFNAGSALHADASAINAFMATHLAAAAGVVSWSLCEWIARGHPSILGACSGAVAGLVCVTPAAGDVHALWGIVLGLAAGVVCYYAVTKLKNVFGYDDSLDAFGVHGVGGTLGAILTGVFATSAVRGNSGLLEGNAHQLVNQFISIAVTALLAAVGSFILLKIIDATIGLRVTQEQELRGLDVSEHNEEGYIFL